MRFLKNTPFTFKESSKPGIISPSKIFTLKYVSELIKFLSSRGEKVFELPISGSRYGRGKHTRRDKY